MTAASPSLRCDDWCGVVCGSLWLVLPTGVYVDLHRVF